MKLRIGAISFELEAERDERGALAMPIADEPSAPARLLHVRGVARVSDTEATPEQLRALGRAVHRRCPVANMIVLSGCVLDVDFVGVDGVDDHGVGERSGGSGRIRTSATTS